MSDKLAAEKDRVVSFHYVLTEVEGAELESSRSGEPMAALIGHANMMEGLEAALIGRTAGEQFEVALAPEQTFGERRDDWTQRIQKKHVPKGTRLRPGAQIQLQTDDGPRLVTVVKVVRRQDPGLCYRTTRGARGQRGRAGPWPRPWCRRASSLIGKEPNRFSLPEKNCFDPFFVQVATAAPFSGLFLRRYTGP
jgi:hypothetical protein